MYIYLYCDIFISNTFFITQVAMVGAPNVGKSSLVHMLSSGNPTVHNYPFTTRNIVMGHFFVDAEKC